MHPIAETIAETLGALSLGAPQTFRGLTVVPLVSGNGRAPDYVTLDEALAGRLARVTEVSEGGSVPELRFVNDSPEKVLLVDGEELVGAKQNRVLNVTILVGAKQTVTIPVSCVEQGRWRHTSAEFASANRAHFARGRAAKAAQVSASLRTSGSRRSDQSQVWEAIRSKADHFSAASPTGAMGAVFETQAEDLGAYERALPPGEGQAGAVFAIGGKVAGLDLFDAPATLGKLWAKLLGSYALDALEEAPEAGKGGEAAAEAIRGEAAAFLARVGAARAERFPGVGLGEDLRLEGRGLCGRALAEGGRVVHLNAFRLEGEGQPRDAGRRPAMARASQRRGHRR
ncbi:MAG: DUF6569 family protein [Deferrisomatales bacterium]|nr:DUF6569 family protein [Deferrisomatales bacterium]